MSIFIPRETETSTGPRLAAGLGAVDEHDPVASVHLVGCAKANPALARSRANAVAAFLRARVAGLRVSSGVVTSRAKSVRVVTTSN